MTSGGDVSAQSVRRMTLPPIYGLALEYSQLILFFINLVTAF